MRRHNSSLLDPQARFPKPRQRWQPCRARIGGPKPAHGRLDLSFLHSGLLALAATLMLAAGAAAQTNYATEPEPSMASKFSSSVKSGFGKMTRALVPKSEPKGVPDPISLSVPATPSAEFHVAVARMAEQSGDYAKAEHHYRQALDLAPKSLEALMGYAHMLDRQEKLDQAVELYRRVVTLYPNSPTAHNDLGICHARQGRLDEAVESIEKAIRLEPKQARYRNNIATILIQSRQPEKAFTHLSAVHPPAAACYNLGYLLQKGGDKASAAEMFRQALALDPSLMEARNWLEQLQPSVAAANRARPAASGAARSSRPAAPAAAAAPGLNVPPPGSAAPMPPANTWEPLPQIPPANLGPAGRALSPQMAPLPSISPLPPTQRGYGNR